MAVLHSGQTALYTAARKGHFDILAQLLNYRYTDIDVQTQTGSTALHGLYTVVFVLTLPAAAYFAMPECAAMLLISGADLTIKNQHTLTPSQEVHLLSQFVKLTLFSQANGMSCKVIDIWEKHRPYEAIERLRTLYPAMYVVPKEDLAMLDIRGRLKVRELAVKPNAAG